MAHIPKYCHHKQKNLAYVTINGRVIYLGKYDSPESHNNYDKTIAEWLSNNRMLESEYFVSDFSVSDLVARYLDHSINYYLNRRTNKPTSHYHKIKSAVVYAHRYYGDLPIEEFRARHLKAIRTIMIDKKYVRGTINQWISLIKAMFRWGAEEELFSDEIYHRIKIVKGLQLGRSDAKESKSVKGITYDRIHAVKPHIPTLVWDMVQIQLLTGMRPGEVVGMKGSELVTGSEVWEYLPESHKTAHKGKSRFIFIGPRAQVILSPYLIKHVAGYLFQSPAIPGEPYTVAAYRRCITRACKRIDIDKWTPHQLRHTRADEIENLYDIDSACDVLGHQTTKTTLTYLERRKERARRVMKEIG